ncbi:MAG TPA: NlpC/P60 family protein [Thermomonospora sp.]|nr:NlpC/P60 family protein [Thermomonospora sp.]
MSIPLKAVCGAATLAFALVPGVTEAQAAERADTAGAFPDDSGSEHAVPSSPSFRGRRPFPGWPGKSRPPQDGTGLGPHIRPGQHGHLRPVDPAQEADPGEPVDPETAVAPALAQGTAALPEEHAAPVGYGFHGRASAHLHAHALLARQRAVRQRRARLIAQWQNRADRAVSFALAQRGKPYRWGATGPSAYDCSGLVHRAWRRAGVSIPRVTYDQYRGIRKKVARRNLRPGDLVLFRGLRHVGMYVGGGRFVHAPRPGRTISTERLRGYYARTYVGAVRPAWPRLPEIPTH